MKIKTTEFGTVVLTADEGMVLQGLDGGIGKEIWLAKSDSPENYIEIPEDQVLEQEENMNEIGEVEIIE